MTYSRTLSIILVPIASLILTSCTSQQTPIARSNPTHIEKVVENTSSTSTGTTAIGSTVTMEAINGISVPPEPDAVLNNATLAGIDANNNRVRDDVERMVAKIVSSKQQFENVLPIIQAYQIVILAPTPKNREDGLVLEKGLLCSATDYSLIPNTLRGTSDTSIESMIFNTEDRKEKLQKLRSIVGGFDSEEVYCDKNTSAIDTSSGVSKQDISENTERTNIQTGGTINMEVINGISVPPEPDTVLNNATLAGVDVNNNGVRDDVERIIAQSSSSKMIFDTSILYVKKLSSLIFLPTPSTNEEATKMMLSPECVIEGNSQYLVQIHFMQVIFNTPERMTKIKAISKLVPAMTAQDVKDYDCRK